jgi:glycosyltransferase involved in cell wall biosynthesis
MRKKILLKGPILTRSGYGEQARFALRALRSREDIFDIYIQPLQWGQTSWIYEDTPERRWIDDKIGKTVEYVQSGGKFDVSMQVTIPNEWDNLAPINIGYTAGIETDRVAPEWIVKANSMNSVIVVSEHSKNVFKDSHYASQQNPQQKLLLQRPISAVNYPVKKFEELPDVKLDLETGFNFLCVAQMGPRKNIENVIKSFINEFRNEDVGLILKTNQAKNCFMDRESTFGKLQNAIKSYGKRRCKIYLLHGDMTDEEMHALYTHPNVHAFVTMTHGEGFGLPIFEAAYSGLPVISPGWSGQNDFLYDENGKARFYEVEHTLQEIPKEAVWNGVIMQGSMWCEPSLLSAQEKMRRAYLKISSGDKTGACEYATELAERFSEANIHEQFVSAIIEQTGEIEPEVQVEIKDLPKISLVTSVFKADDYIEQLMEDVTRQTIFEEKCEWIILNANPAGEEFDEEVILRYVEKYPDNIIYKRLEEDPGIYDTWNMAIKMSTGEFVTNVNCDDRRPPDAYEKQAKLLVGNPDVSLVYNDSYITHEPNVTWEDVPPNCQQYHFEQFSKEAMLRSNLPHNNPMWRRSLHNKFGYFNQDYKSAGDWDLWLRCAFGGAKFKKHSEVLGVYYFNPTGMSTNPEHDSWKREHEREIFQNYMQIYQQQQQHTQKQAL